MDKFIITNPRRPAEDMIQAYAEHDVSTIYEAQGKQGLMQPYLRPIQQDRKICGPAVTVTCPAGDNLMIHAAVEVCKPGDIIVITTIGESTAGMIGELIVTALMKKGVQGMVIDAGIRDVKQLRDMGFPVWAKSVHSAGTTKSRGGWVNAPAVCGGVTIEAGDLVVADDDGVVMVRYDDLQSTLQLTNARIRKEADTKAKIASGQISLDFYNLRPILAEEKVAYYDSLDELSLKKDKQLR